MVVESTRICGKVGFVLGVTSYLGRAWWDLELHGVTAWVFWCCMYNLFCVFVIVYKLLMISTRARHCKMIAVLAGSECSNIKQFRFELATQLNGQCQDME